MAKIALLDSCLCLLMWARMCVGQIDCLPFEVKVIENTPAGRQLDCTNTLSFSLEEAIFFRNSIEVTTTDPCLSTSQSAKFIFNNTPECDGKYSCGRIQDGQLILSGPKTVLALPKRITSDDQAMSVCLGCTVNLPSNLRVSALNAQKIIWRRIKQGVYEDVQNPQINPDYSLTITDVGRSDMAAYYAEATNSEGVVNGPQVELRVIKKPIILSDIMYLVSSSSIQLSIIAEGDSLRYDWKINGNLQLSSGSSVLTISALPQGMNRIAVNVSNKIGFDYSTILIQASGENDATSDPPGTVDELCISHTMAYITSACILVVLVFVAVVFSLFGWFCGDHIKRHQDKKDESTARR